jgi:hypothetical protein
MPFFQKEEEIWLQLLIAEIGLYAELGLLIENDWFEQPPMTDDRDKLANL